jgi:hypothetical protein
MWDKGKRIDIEYADCPISIEALTHQALIFEHFEPLQSRIPTFRVSPELRLEMSEGSTYILDAPGVPAAEYRAHLQMRQRDA